MPYTLVKVVAHIVPHIYESIKERSEHTLFDHGIMLTAQIH